MAMLALPISCHSYTLMVFSYLCSTVAKTWTFTVVWHIDEDTGPIMGAFHLFREWWLKIKYPNRQYAISPQPVARF